MNLVVVNILMFCGNYSYLLTMESFVCDSLDSFISNSFIFLANLDNNVAIYQN